MTQPNVARMVLPIAHAFTAGISGSVSCAAFSHAHEGLTGWCATLSQNLHLNAGMPLSKLAEGTHSCFKIRPPCLQRFCAAGQFVGAQVMAFRDHSKDKGIPVTSLRDVLQFARPLVEFGTVLGLYIETKQPTWHEDIGLPLEQPLLDALDAEGWFQMPAGAIVLQSFEPQASKCPANHPWLLSHVKILLAEEFRHAKSHRAEAF